VQRLPWRVLALFVAVVLLPVPVAGRSGAPYGAVRVISNVVYARPGGVPLQLDVYVPAKPSRRAGLRPAAVLVHGGGFRVGDKRTLASRGLLLAARGWVAFSVNYRLGAAPAWSAAAPERLPAPVADVTTAVRWVRSHAERFRVDPARVVALGDSAGGTLVGMLATLGDGPRDRGARVAAAVSWSGPQDLRTLADDRAATELPKDARHYLGCDAASCPGHALSASPIGHVDATDAPMLLANATDELVPLEQATAMGAALAAAGVERELLVVRGSAHARHYAGRAWGRTLRFMEAAVGAPRR
jgi:acetyl esterase